MSFRKNEVCFKLSLFIFFLAKKLSAPANAAAASAHEAAKKKSASFKKAELNRKGNEKTAGSSEMDAFSDLASPKTATIPAPVATLAPAAAPPSAPAAASKPQAAAAEPAAAVPEKKLDNHVEMKKTPSPPATAAATQNQSSSSNAFAEKKHEPVAPAVNNSLLPAAVKTEEPKAVEKAASPPAEADQPSAAENSEAADEQADNSESAETPEDEGRLKYAYKDGKITEDNMTNVELWQLRFPSKPPTDDVRTRKLEFAALLLFCNCFFENALFSFLEDALV